MAVTQSESEIRVDDIISSDERAVILVCPLIGPSRVIDMYVRRINDAVVIGQESGILDSRSRDRIGAVIVSIC